MEIKRSLRMEIAKNEIERNIALTDFPVDNCELRSFMAGVC